jgi:hypothetical protein
MMLGMAPDGGAFEYESWAKRGGDDEFAVRGLVDRTTLETT